MADYNAQFQMGPNGSAPVTYFEPDKVNIVFYSRSVPDAEASKAAGRPQFKAVDYVRIQHPGERDYTDDPVSEKPEIAFRFPRQWEAYQKNKQYVPEGTPIDFLFAQDAERAIASTLRANGIHTVEQLANLNADSIGQQGLYAQHYVNHAKKYLETSKGGVAYHKMQSELEKRDNQLEVQGNQIKALQATVDRLLAEKSGAAQQTLLSPYAQSSIAQQAIPVAKAEPGALPPPVWMQQQSASPAAAPPASAQMAMPPPPWMQNVQPVAELADAPQPPAPVPPTQIAIPENTPPPKSRGWPKGKPRGPRKSTEG